MTAVDVAWQGLDDETRLDVASIDFAEEGGFVATGRQSTETWRVQWDLVVDSRWRTKFVTLDAEGYVPVSLETNDVSRETADEGGWRERVWQRHLNLWRRDDGARSLWRWEGDGSGDAPGWLAPLGMEDGMELLLSDAVDVDLGGCPVTNTMPIRRLGVDAAGVGERPITTAWVRLPVLAVMPSPQVYSSGPQALTEAMTVLDPRVFSVVHYRSATRDVSVDLTVDDHGLVLTYPDLAARVDVP